MTFLTGDVGHAFSSLSSILYLCYPLGWLRLPNLSLTHLFNLQFIACHALGWTYLKHNSDLVVSRLKTVACFPSIPEGTWFTFITVGSEALPSVFFTCPLTPLLSSRVNPQPRVYLSMLHLWWCSSSPLGTASFPHFFRSYIILLSWGQMETFPVLLQLLRHISTTGFSFNLLKRKKYIYENYPWVMHI